ncbi:hypothetical protein AgCh_011217 [Apium graveolens]
MVRKQHEDIKALTVRLEGRIRRSREHQEQMLNTLRNEQLKFQAEMRSTVTCNFSNQTQIGDKPAGSIAHNNMGSVSPRLGVGMGGSFEGKNGNGVNNQTIEEGGYGSGGGYIGGHGVYGGSGSGGGPGNWRYRKLDMSVFDGNNLDGWILRVERYFAFYRMAEEEMLEAVVVALEGDVQQWY